MVDFTRQIGVTLSKSAMLLAMATSIAPAWAQHGLQDGSFDTQGSTVASYCYFNVNCPSGSWGEGSGLIRSGASPWGSPQAYSGTHLAFIQSSSTISQSFIATSTSNTFQVNWQEMDRPVLGGQSYRVLVNNTVIGTFTSSGDGYVKRVSAPFAMVAGMSYKLSFQGLDAVDRSALIDDVTITIAAEILSYTYDAKGRLINVTVAGGVNDNVSSTYGYDAADNRKRVTVVKP